LKRYLGELEFGDVRVGGIEVLLEENVKARSEIGLSSWHGTLTIPPAYAAKLFLNEKPIRLRVAGRSGEILFEHIDPATGEVRFEGTGELR
jgi:hypothetical protein